MPRCLRAGVLRTGLVSAMLLSLFVDVAKADVFRPINDRPFMTFVAQLEGPDGYDEVVKGATSKPPRRLTAMTVREVLDYQEKLQREGAASTAMGQYQVIRKTLNEFVERGEISDQDRFDKRTQDRLARILMNRCGFYEPDREEVHIGNCLARAWAALPVLSGKKKGLSFYDHVGSNKALTTTTAVLEVLQNRFEPTVFMLASAERVPLPAISNREPARFADPVPLSSNNAKR